MFIFRCNRRDYRPSKDDGNFSSLGREKGLDGSTTKDGLVGPYRVL